MSHNLWEYSIEQNIKDNLEDMKGMMKDKKERDAAFKNSQKTFGRA